MGAIKFGTDGWRAIMAEEFTFGNFRRVVAAIARELKSRDQAKKGVVIGHDTRFLAERFARSAASVLAGADIKCFLMERDCPTPVTAFTVVDRGAGGALMITASHNPPEYNGLKFIPEYGGPATEAITSQIEQELSRMAPDEKIFEVSEDRARSRDLFETIDPVPNYFARIRSLVDFETIRKADLDVVYDPIYGTGRGYLDTLLAQAGVKVRVLHNYRDPLFGGGMPEPSPAELGSLLTTVKESGADLGLATDGDSDRFGVYDKLGEFLSPNQLLSIIFVHLVRRRKFSGVVVRSVATTHLLDKIAKKLGVTVVETPVGFKHIGERMMKENVILGGEESGGLSILGHIPEKDGVLANLLACEVAAIEKRPLSQVLKSIMDEFGEVHSDRINMKLKDEEHKRRVMDALRSNPPTSLGTQHVEEVRTIDGVKMILKDGSWVLIRPSGTEPMIRTYIEAPSREGLRRLQRAAEDLTR